MILEHKSLELFGKTLFEKAIVKPPLMLPTPMGNEVATTDLALLNNHSLSSFKIKFKNIGAIILWMLVLVFGSLNAQDYHRESGMKIISDEIIIFGPPEKTWEALAEFGNVSHFLSTIDEGSALNGSKNLAIIGAERESIIPKNITNIIQKERIIELVEGAYYTYEVYESENFPMKKMYVTYGVKLDSKGNTIMYGITEYKMNSGLATRMMKGKLSKGNMDTLIAYKYYIETGEKNTDIDSLRRRYDEEISMNSENDLVVNYPRSRSK